MVWKVCNHEDEGKRRRREASIVGVLNGTTGMLWLRYGDDVVPTREGNSAWSGQYGLWVVVWTVGEVAGQFQHWWPCDIQYSHWF